MFNQDGFEVFTFFAAFYSSIVKQISFSLSLHSHDISFKRNNNVILLGWVSKTCWCFVTAFQLVYSHQESKLIQLSKFQLMISQIINKFSEYLFQMQIFYRSERRSQINKCYNHFELNKLLNRAKGFKAYIKGPGKIIIPRKITWLSVLIFSPFFRSNSIHYLNESLLTDRYSTV